MRGETDQPRESQDLESNQSCRLGPGVSTYEPRQGLGSTDMGRCESEVALNAGADL